MQCQKIGFSTPQNELVSWAKV